MGLFDTIFCEMELPLTDEIKKELSNINWKEVDFQTKDLNRSMDSYKIDKDGNLFFVKVEGDMVDCKESFSGKRFVETNKTFIADTHFGVIEFYHYIDQNDFNYWVEFKSKIDDGKVRSIELTKFEKRDNKQQKLLLEKHLSECKNTTFTDQLRIKLRGFLYRIASRI